MFDLANWGDPESLMLNLTNLGFGIFMLWFVLSVTWVFMQELVLRIRKPVLHEPRPTPAAHH